MGKVPLEESWLFQGLPAAVLGKIRLLASEERFPGGTTIFAEGDPASSHFILGDGEVELTYVLPSRDPVTMRIARVGPGDRHRELHGRGERRG